MKVKRRKRWRNHTRNQSVEPLRQYRPRSEADLREAVAAARADGVTARAVGSGHSWSDAALTRGYLIETHGLDKLLDVGPRAPGWEDRKLVRVEAGMRLRKLNKLLAAQGLALSQMGGYDGQTVAGVMSTSTHGSGIGLGPLPDSVHSIDLMAGDGGCYRIERTGGPTAGAAPDGWELVADDDAFDAVSVSIGCMGVIYAATLEVEPAYWLTEKRVLSTWPEVRKQLETRAPLEASRHYEVYLNPYGERRCIVCTRNLTEDPQRWRPRHSMRRHWYVELLSSVRLTAWVANALLDLWPAMAPRAIDFTLRLLKKDDYTNRSYRVLNIGAANLLPAYSSEIGVPIDDGKHLEAIDRIIEIADRHGRLGDVYHTAPIALRFVKASPAHLSMMHGRDTMMIELIQMTDTEGGYELLAEYEDALYALGGRPHWGQFNTLTGSDGALGRMYPALDRWLAVRERFDPENVFASPFSKRVGIGYATETRTSADAPNPSATTV